VKQNLPRETLLEMYRRMRRIRLFEDTAEEIHRNGEVPGTCHTSQGQEGEIVGACMALRLDDYMVGNHRSHGHPIGKGARLDRLMAELMARKTGVCGGKGGSMHLADFSVGSLGETSIVGSGIPVAAGAALGAKMKGLDRVSLVEVLADLDASRDRLLAADDRPSVVPQLLAERVATGTRCLPG